MIRFVNPRRACIAAPCAAQIPGAAAAARFAALGSEQRSSVLRARVRAGKVALATGELGQRCGVTGSTLTHHLRVLSRAELVRQQRKGRSVICAAVACPEIHAICNFVLAEC